MENLEIAVLVLTALFFFIGVWGSKLSIDFRTLEHDFRTKEQMDMLNADEAKKTAVIHPRQQGKTAAMGEKYGPKKMFCHSCETTFLCGNECVCEFKDQRNWREWNSSLETEEPVTIGDLVKKQMQTRETTECHLTRNELEILHDGLNYHYYNTPITEKSKDQLNLQNKLIAIRDQFED